ncbi:hypothetical protein NEMIN01_1221 [Nematocida minor]|uniref:uncharacterized protein n=1 Tax=Nematocida minor TaxID=1912983 RepID=UPI0022207851|nr:uncharacterized protein NEMIN01_1221 [Nematocida minor]KAI5190819.1 hypothetical protein NEMIN01_1221 [Nematocida minor]
MEKEQANYDKETAEIFSDPYAYAVDMHIENIKKPENTVEIKKEYIQGLETILVRQDISTATSIFPKLEKCVELIDTPSVESDMCAMLGHIAQNVEPVAKELLRCKVFSKCIDLYKSKPETVNKILFLFTVINNTVADLSNELRRCNEDPSIIKDISPTDVHLNERSKERLIAISQSLGL